MKINVLSSRKHLLQIMSVLSSILLWFYVLNSARVKFEKTVSVDYILPEHVVFAQRPMSEVTFILEGPRAFMRTILEREDKIVIDLRKPEYRKGLRFAVNLRPGDLKLPFGVNVERILPRKLPVRLERKSSKKLAIRPVFSGALPPELKVISSKLQPMEVEVYGPRSVMSGLKEIPTKPIELESLIGQEVLPLELVLPDDRITVTTTETPLLHYRLKALRSNLVMEDVPVRFLSSATVVAKRNTATLVLLAPESIARSRDRSNLNVQIWADVPEGAKGRVEVDLRPILPPGIHMIEIRPKRILVDVE